MRLLLLFLLVPICSFAQSALVTEFPPEATPLSSEAIKTRFSGKTFAFRGASGGEIRMQFQAPDVLVSAGPRNDSGPWKIEGSAICIEFRVFKSGCNEVRSVKESLYWKRNSNGEVVQLTQQ